MLNPCAENVWAANFGSICSLLNMVMVGYSRHERKLCCASINESKSTTMKRGERGKRLNNWGRIVYRRLRTSFLIPIYVPFPLLSPSSLFFSQCWVLMDRDWDKTDFLSSFIMKDIVYWEPSGAEKQARLSFLFLYVSWFHFVSTPLSRSSCSSISLRLLVPHENVLPLSDSFSNHCGGPEFSFIGKKNKNLFFMTSFCVCCLFQWVRKANKNCRNCS